MFPSINGIELVTCTKLLGASRLYSRYNLNGNMHVYCILSLCSQRIFFIKRIQAQGLALKYLHNVFRKALLHVQAYCMLCQHGGVFLCKELSGSIDAYLKRCYQYGFSLKKLIMWKPCLSWIQPAWNCVTKYAFLVIICMV